MGLVVVEGHPVVSVYVEEFVPLEWVEVAPRDQTSQRLCFHPNKHRIKKSFFFNQGQTRLPKKLDNSIQQ